jgi:hypothetical protein
LERDHADGRKRQNEGNLQDALLFLFSGYRHGLITLFVSHWVVQEEVQFLNLLNTMGYVMMCFMIFMGLISIHEYGLFKTVATIFVTAVAASIILFIFLLIFDLSQQIYGFLYSLYREITTRFI